MGRVVESLRGAEDENLHAPNDGNRGCLHDASGRIRRRHNGMRWIACRLEFRGWQPLVPLLHPSARAGRGGSG